MTKLFNKGGDGAGEIVRVLGLIDNDLDFTKWEPILPLGIRDLQAIIGTEPIDAVDKYYREDHADGTEPDSMAETLRLMQQAVAMFTWLKVIPTLDAQHGTAGRGKHLGENETGMTALQEFKDEENIRNLAYEAVDALVELLDREKFDFWMNGIKKKAINRLLIQNKETFDEYYNIGSHRLFLVLIPMIREVQDGQIIPVITRNRYNKLIEGDTVLTEKLLEYVRRPLALLTIKRPLNVYRWKFYPMESYRYSRAQPYGINCGRKKRLGNRLLTVWSRTRRLTWMYCRISSGNWMRSRKRWITMYRALPYNLRE